MNGGRFFVPHPDRVRVKCCGLTAVEDALSAVRLGVDAVGLVFYRPSPRYVTAAAACAISAALPPDLTRVGLFVNAPEEEVEAVLAAVPLDLLQFHGTETPAYCRRFARPYLKAVHLGAAARPPPAFPGAFALLLDSFQGGRPGGTGKTFDWSLARDFSGPRIVLAGGLNAANVAQAIRAVEPYAVDVSSGVELSPGRKDPAKIAAFIDEVKQAHA